MNDLGVTRRSAVAGLLAAALPARFANAASASIATKIVVEDGRLWVAATIGASEPLNFIIDTGTPTNLLRPEIAATLKLTKAGGGVIGGVGGKIASTGVVEARDIVIGGVMRQPRMYFQTYDFARDFSPDTAGLFAAGLVTAYDSDLVFSEGLWRIWPDGREGRAAGMPLEGSSITARGERGAERLYVNAKIDGQTYRLGVDTGAPRGLLLFPRASRKSGLLDGRATAPVPTAGFGGRAEKLSHIVRAASFELGPLQFDRPFVTLMDPDQTTRFDLDGLLGLPIITMFDWSTEVQASRISVARNAIGLVADRYPKTGLWLSRLPGGGAVVDRVGLGSPAAKAGILEKDEIVEPARFEDAVRRINGPVRQEIELAVRRGTTTTRHRLLPVSYL